MNRKRRMLRSTCVKLFIELTTNEKITPAGVSDDFKKSARYFSNTKSDNHLNRTFPNIATPLLTREKTNFAAELKIVFSKLWTSQVSTMTSENSDRGSRIYWNPPTVTADTNVSW